MVDRLGRNIGCLLTAAYWAIAALAATVAVLVSLILAGVL